MKLVLRHAPLFVLALAACGDAQEGTHVSAAAPVLAVLSDSSSTSVGELRSGRLSEARGRLERALARDPDGMAALNDLGVSYAVEERFDAARQLLEEVLAHGSPRDQQIALVNLGELYAIEGYLDAALAHLASARAIDATRPEPAYALALLDDLRGDRASSQLALKAALEADRNSAVRRELAFLYADEKVHLDALLAESVGDASTAAAKWRDLAKSDFPALAALAQRRIEEP